MPKIVNHEERRREVTAVAVELVTSHGRGALTVRNVAKAAGCSTTVVSHYFEDMAELFYETYDYAARRSSLRIAKALENDPGDVVSLVEAVLPLDKERTEDWRLWFAFWSEALTTPRYSEEQRRRARNAIVRIETCLRIAVSRGEIDKSVDITSAAERLGALTAGIASEAIFDPKKWTPARQRNALRTELQLLGLH
jgi:AcrR family transcriptional regulator